MKPNGFPKARHLCLQRSIERLFDESDGRATAWPLRLVWRTTDGTGVQVLASVAKRHLHHAVDRNRAKRQIREAYRLNNDGLRGNSLAAGLHLAFVWLADTPVPSEKVERSLRHLLNVCQERLPDRQQSQTLNKKQ
ncbi:MAG: ribonuclease P protein component [Bacteroidales bacterium]|nr:ribonuclease P protein component [Candidatus Equimonas faecalis]